MSTEENKALVRRYIQAIDDNDSSDWSLIDEFVAADFVAHNPPIPGVGLDRDGLKQAAEIFRVATPGTHEIPLQVAEGDLVVSHIVGRGVHAGELLGIPATNREVETDGIAIHRVRDGKIVEYWSVTDVARVLMQVGALSGPHERERDRGRQEEQAALEGEEDAGDRGRNRDRDRSPHDAQQQRDEGGGGEPGERERPECAAGQHGRGADAERGERERHSLHTANDLRKRTAAGGLQPGCRDRRQPPPRPCGLPRSPRR
jgi:predicted ester cyclase